MDGKNATWLRFGLLRAVLFCGFRYLGWPGWYHLFCRIASALDCNTPLLPAYAFAV